MTQVDPNNAQAIACNIHLIANETACRRSNIIVHVETINADQSVAFCTVEQRRTGLFHRNRSVHELVHGAEQALAPLIGPGIVPLVSVRHVSLKNTTTAPRAAERNTLELLSDLFHWLGFPDSRERVGTPALVGDPFGWRQALARSTEHR